MRSFAQEDYEISRYSEKVDETLKLGLGQAVSCLILPPLTRKEGGERERVRKMQEDEKENLISCVFFCRKWLVFSLEA